MFTYEEIDTLYQQLVQRHFVPNLIQYNDMQLLFILESPHIKEVANKYPVASISGYSMSKVVLNNNDVKIPLGKIVYEKHQHISNEYPHLQKIGLMNVCQIPMQIKAYDERDINQKTTHFISILEDIRTHIDHKKFTDDHYTIQRYVLKQFQLNLEKLKDIPLYIVPCGKTARDYFNLSAVNSPNWTLLMDIPHPSRNSWQWSVNEQVINQLKAYLQNPVE